MTLSEEMEEMGMTISMMGAELLATKKELKGALAALEEAQQQLSEAKEINAKWALDALFKDETEVERKLAEAQQTIARQREALIATGLPEWAVDAIGKGETQP